MKYTKTKVLRIDLTLDSSEMVMFTKGGKHEISFKQDYDPERENDDGWLFHQLKEDWDEIKFTVQLERNQQGRFDFVNDEAEKHKERVKNETQSS